MAVAVVLFLYLLGFFMPKSKIIYILMMIYMWVLFSFNTGAPDTPTYEELYNNFIPGAFEPGFSLIMYICKLLCMPYIGFRMTVALLLLIFVNLSFKKVEKYKTLALAIYMITPFLWGISGIRASLAGAIIIYAISEFALEPRSKTKKYCFLLFCATMIHYSSILFAILLLCRRDISPKIIKIFIEVSIIGVLIVQNFDILFDLVSKITTRQKIIGWLRGGINVDGYPNIKGFILELIVLFGNVFLTVKSEKIIFEYDYSETKKIIAKSIRDINIISILYIPFLRLNDTYMRLLYVIHGANIVLFAITAQVLQENGDLFSDDVINPLVGLRIRFCYYTIIVPIWTFAIIIYQNYSYFGTERSVFEFLGKNILFD